MKASLMLATLRRDFTCHASTALILVSARQEWDSEGEGEEGPTTAAGSSDGSSGEGDESWSFCGVAPFRGLGDGQILSGCFSPNWFWEELVSSSLLVSGVAEQGGAIRCT